MIGRRRAALAGLALTLAILVRPLFANQLSKPIGILYATASVYLESLAQIYLWAILVGAFVLLALRQLPLSVRSRTEPRPTRADRRGRVGAWVRMLGDRKRGSYFEWRVASRLAELEDWEDAGGAADPQHRAYLQLGRDRRTIALDRSFSELNFELEALVAYLEDALDRR